MHWQRTTKGSWLAIISLVLFGVDLAMSQFPFNHDIHVVEVKTGRVVQISGVPDAGEFNPSWSPNSKQIAHDVVGGPAPLGHSIFITNVETGVSTLLAGAEGGNDAAWSPNGQKIAFDRANVGDPSIYIVPSSGGTPTLVKTDAVDPAWSPNSKRLVFQQPSDGSIRTVDESGGAETLVAASGFNPVWSPNGQWIAFADGGDIWKARVNIFGVSLGSPVQVTTAPAFENQPSWSNNSMTIVFHSDADGDFDLWTIPAAGGTATKLTGLAGQGDFDPSFSNNGQHVAYAGFTEPPSLTSVNSQKFVAPPLFDLAQNYPNPFNPETEIGFRIPEANHVVVRIFNTLGEEIRTLVDAPFAAGSHSVRWDGKAENGEAVASGVYLYQLRAGRFMKVKKMSLLR
ncbi:T9SS type A sorting domain-containing protein [candidate division KSB1 bacterium]|nr:T9SS type A sorting domain-containing protein [candidate division KSB1 bacterium]